MRSVVSGTPACSQLVAGSQASVNTVRRISARSMPRVTACRTRTSSKGATCVRRL